MLNNEQRVRIFRALADETRLNIVRILYVNNKEMSCGELGRICDASKSNTSYYFRILREANLIKVRKDAQTKYASIDLETFHFYLPGFLNTL
ncbi:ArsR/SmtB family transcription factor [Paenibacillus rhizosphaerae]|uniref:ArsR/SmtB family transcription factor n=1 Tax=Paenibacillus rhizosphaerae TaxID=297318 RepID=UPI00160B3C4B|nr:metalloregulator ArsR/SmtB family transcription factor [Paenibacillus rhizosphaerae]